MGLRGKRREYLEDKKSSYAVQEDFPTSFDEVNRLFAQRMKKKRAAVIRKTAVRILAAAAGLALLIAVEWHVVEWRIEKERKTVILEMETAKREAEAKKANDIADGRLPEVPKAYVTEENAAPEDCPLTKQEQKRWATMKVEEGEIPIELNHRIAIDELLHAGVRAINPAYSAYTIQIKLHRVEGDIVYRSEKLSPGTILETMILPEDFAMDAEEESALIEYLIYKDDEKLGRHKVEVTLVRSL